MVEGKTKNKVAVEAHRTKLSLMGNINSPAELAKAMTSASKDLYSNGASWNGDALTYLGYGVVMAIIAYAVWFDANHKCVAWEERYECRTDTDYDSYGSSYSYTYCGWYDYCTLYEKK